MNIIHTYARLADELWYRAQRIDEDLMQHGGIMPGYDARSTTKRDGFERRGRHFDRAATILKRKAAIDI